VTPDVRRLRAAAIALAALVAFLLARCGDGPQPSPGTPSPSSPQDVATFAQILVVYRSDAKPDWPRTKAQALARAKEALGRLRAGRPIEEVTAEFTDDRDASGAPFNSGTQTIRRGVTRELPVVTDRVFRLKPGELLGDPLDTGVAYVVIRRES
jgi:hypothetical protein